MAGQSSHPQQASVLLALIQQLYDIEDRAKVLTSDDRRAMRERESRLVLDHIGLNHLSWITAVTVDGTDRLPEILECHLVSGDFDYLIKARIPDMNAYRTLLGELLRHLPGVRNSKTLVVMEEVKETTRIPIPER